MHSITGSYHENARVDNVQHLQRSEEFQMNPTEVPLSGTSTEMIARFPSSGCNFSQTSMFSHLDRLPADVRFSSTLNPAFGTPQTAEFQQPAHVRMAQFSSNTVPVSGIMHEQGLFLKDIVNVKISRVIF